MSEQEREAIDDWREAAARSGREPPKTLAELSAESRDDQQLAPNGEPYYPPFEDEAPPTPNAEAIAEVRASVDEATPVEEEDEAESIETLGGIVAALVDLGSRVKAHQGPDFNQQVARGVADLDPWQRMYCQGFLLMAGRAALPGFQR